MYQFGLQFRDVSAGQDERTECRFIELRLEGERKIVGNAMVYGDVATMPWGEEERFESGAFGNISDADVIANVMHDRVTPVARTGGGGLRLMDDNDSLRIEAELPETRAADDALVLVKKKILRGLSVEFIPEDVRWEGNTRIIERAELTGIGIVDRPAYPHSRVNARRREMPQDNPPNDNGAVDIPQTIQTAVQAAVAAMRDVNAAGAEQMEAFTGAVTTAVEGATAEIRAENTRLQGEVDAATAAKDQAEARVAELEGESETRRTEAEAAAQERAELIAEYRAGGLIPDGTDLAGKSVKDIMVIAAGDEVEDAANRSEDYLRASLKYILERRALGPQSPGVQAGDVNRVQPSYSAAGSDIVRMINKRSAAAQQALRG